jgi:hypothetical protein
MIAFRRVLTLYCLVAISITACGFGTSPGPPYDFSTLETTIGPIRDHPSLKLLDRRQYGSNCRGQGCERPRVVYVFEVNPPQSCDFIQRLPSSFTDITGAFTRSSPEWCAYVGEVQGHAVVVEGHLMGGELLHAWPGQAEEVQVTVFADGRRPPS